MLSWQSKMIIIIKSDIVDITSAADTVLINNGGRICYGMVFATRERSSSL